VRTRQLKCERTRTGQRLFLLTEVRRAADQRLTARLAGKRKRPLKMLWTGVGPRQLSLLSAPLRIVARGERGTSPR
jgi:hypothetical protein